jgi:type III secretion apparatus needle protein
MSAAGDNPNDPTNLIRMQAAMAEYNTALMVASSVVKSVEETAKSITQKL